MLTRRTSGTAAAALTVATSLYLAAATGTASAATPAFYGGTTSANVVELALTIPGLTDQIPNNTDGTVGLGLIGATGTLVADPGGISDETDQNTGFAGLGSGNLVAGENAPFGALNQSVTSTSAEPGPKTAEFGSLPPDNPLFLSGTAGALRAESTATGNTSSAELASLKLGALSDIIPAEIFDPLSEGLTTAGDELSTQLGMLIDQLGGGLGPITGQDPTGTLQDLIDTLNTVNDQIPAAIAALEDASLIDLEGLDSSQSITQAGDAVTSTATTKLAALSLLGGFVTLDGFENSATATVSGVAGAGSAVAQPAVAEVNVNDGVVLLGLDVDGIRAQIGELGLADEVVAGLNDALDQVEAALAQVFDATGVSITQSQGTQEIAPDGRSASAAASGLLISIAPPGSGVDISLAIGAAKASAVAQQPVAVVTPPAPPTPPTPTLAHTGLSMGLASGAAGALVLLAATASRRRRATLGAR